MDNAELGARGEDAAVAYLLRSGMEILDRNWRNGRGELDIIALDGDALVFCEVKTRRTEARGSAEDAVSPAKQRQLIRIARAYLAGTGLDDCPVRFDVIAIRLLSEERALLRHHRAAFLVE